MRIYGLRLFPMAAIALALLLALDLSNRLRLADGMFRRLDLAMSDDVLGTRIAQTIFARRTDSKRVDTIITGATDKPPAGEAEKPQAGSEAAPNLPEIENADRTVLERLSERRALLDKRDKDLGEREQILAAAEKQLEARMAELKALDEAVKADMARKETDVATLKPLVVMYEAMKPKDAARIFEKLDLKAVLPIASSMNPKKFSEVLAQIDPVIAGKLTVGLAAASSSAGSGKGDLPELPDVVSSKTP